MTNLNPDVIIKELIILFKNFMSSLKVRGKFKRTSICKFTECVNSCGFFIISADFIGWKGIHFILTVRIKTEIILLTFFLWLPKFACADDFTDNVVKDIFKLFTNGISNQIEKGETGFSHFRIFLAD